MKKSNIVIYGVMIILILIVWGLIGSSETAKIGINCDMGVGNDGSVFCWKWHQNAIGDIGDTINQVLGK